MTSLVLLGSGHTLPAQKLSSEHFDQKLGKPIGSLAEATGVRSRHYVGSESQIDLAETAARMAMAEAGCEAGDIDLVLSASGVPYQTLPASAPLIMARLGMADGSAAAFDVNSTCLSFVTAFDIAAHRIASGMVKTVLIVSSEVASRALPWESDPETAALFGDGAAAVVVGGADGPGHLRAHHMQTYPSAYDACQIQAGGTRIDYHNDPETFAAGAWFAMDGKELFRITAKHFTGFVDGLLGKAGWAKEDVDIVIPHQASPFAITHMIRQLKLPEEKVVNLAADIGNQIAASIPTTLDVARRSGRMPAGTRALVLGTSAGVSFGGLALEV